MTEIKIHIKRPVSAAILSLSFYKSSLNDTGCLCDSRVLNETRKNETLSSAITDSNKFYMISITNRFSGSVNAADFLVNQEITPMTELSSIIFTQ